MNRLLGGNEPPVLGGAARIPDAEIAWLHAFGARMIERGVHTEDVALCMASMKPDFTEDPVAAADGELEQWNSE